jgi:hypothetical protein
MEAAGSKLSISCVVVDAKEMISRSARWEVRKDGK